MNGDIECSVRNLGKRYGSVVAVDDVSFDLQRNALISIVGPSGAGKTTLLRLIAGLAAPDCGSISFSEPPSRDHPVVLVFQDFLLFPSLTVAANVGFGMRARRTPRREIEQRVRELLAAFGIADKAHQYPGQLSAGQQQRVALARALAVRPRVLLLDEPFAHLDKTLKMDTALFLRRTLSEFGITAIAVTHDLQEAFAMSDCIGIMIDGRLEQIGPVDEVYSRPASVRAARFLGPVNRFPARLLSLMELDTIEHANGHCGSGPPPAPDTALFCRAESMSITADPAGAGVIEEVTFVGLLVLYRVRLRHDGDQYDLSVFSLENGLQPGTRVRVQVSHVLTEEKGDES